MGKSKRKCSRNNAGGGNGEQGPSTLPKVLRSTPSKSVCQDCNPNFTSLEAELKALKQSKEALQQKKVALQQTNSGLRKTLEQMLHENQKKIVEKDKQIVAKDLLNDNLKQELNLLKGNQEKSDENENSEEMKSQLDEVLTSESEKKDKQIEMLKSEIKLMQFHKKLDLLETESHDLEIDDLKKQLKYRDKVNEDLRLENCRLKKSSHGSSQSNDQSKNHTKNLLLLTKFNGASGSIVEKQMETEKQMEIEKQIEIDNKIEKLQKEKVEADQLIFELKSEIETMKKGNEKTQEEAENDAKSLMEIFDEEVKITKKEELIADLTKQLQEKDKLNKEFQSKISLMEGEKSSLVKEVEELKEFRASAKRRIDDNERAFCQKDSIIRQLTKEKEKWQEKNGADQMEVEDQEEEEDENLEIEKLQEEKFEADQLIVELKSEIETLKKIVGANSWNNDEKEVEIDNLKAVVFKKKEEIADLKRRYIKLEEHNDKLKIEINLMKGKSEQAKAKNNDEEIERVRKTLSQKNLQFHSLNLQRIENLKKIQDLEEEKSNLIHVFKLQSKKNEQQLAEKNQQLAELQIEVGKAQKEIQDLKVDNAVLKKEICAGSTQLDEELLENLQDSVNAKNQELEDLKAQISKMASVMMEMVGPKPKE